MDAFVSPWSEYLGISVAVVVAARARDDLLDVDA